MGYLSKGRDITSSEQDIIDVIGALGTPLYYLRVNAAGTNVEWASVAGGGDVSKVGTPVNNQVGIWTGDGTLEGDTALTFSAGVLSSTGLLLSGLTASEIVITDASKNLVSAAVATYPSLTELTYLKGVTSAIQTQFTGKASTTSPTFATSITGSYLTASEILITDGSKNIVSAPVATYPSLTELTYLKGVTSAIQTQLGAKASLTAPTFVTSISTPSVLATANDSGALGASGTAFSDLFLASGGVINWSSGDVVLTHSVNLLTLTGGTLTISGNSAGIGVFKASDTQDAASVCAAVFEGDRATPTANDSVYISLNLSDSVGNQDEFVRLAALADNVTSTSEAGQLRVSLMTAGTLTSKYIFGTENFLPTTNDGLALGTSANMWSDIFLASGAVINFNNGDVTLTHGANVITLGGGDLAIGANNITITGSIGATGARSTKVWATDIESTNMPTVGGTAILTSLTAPQFTTIELGHATDTTISRSAAGVLAVEGVVIPSISSTNTFTNKRITKRTGTTTSHATPTINTDNVDFYSLTAQAEAITSMTTNLSGTPTEGQTLWIAITGTAARAITWGTSFEASTVALPTTTVTTNRLDVGFVWNTVTSKWRCVASC